MNEYQKAILKRIDIFLKMFSNLLIILTNESSFKTKTNKEINIVVPKINEVVKTINKNIYDNQYYIYNWNSFYYFNRSLFNEINQRFY